MNEQSAKYNDACAVLVLMTAVWMNNQLGIVKPVLSSLQFPIKLGECCPPFTRSNVHTC